MAPVVIVGAGGMLDRALVDVGRDRGVPVRAFPGRAALDIGDAAAGEKKTLDVVNDQFGRPSYARDVAHMSWNLIDTGARGVCHVCNGGRCSWYDLAVATVELAGLDCDVRSCPSRDAPRPDRRSANSCLDLSRTVAMVGAPPHWRAALEVCLRRMAAPDSGPLAV